MDQTGEDQRARAASHARKPFSRVASTLSDYPSPGMEAQHYCDGPPLELFELVITDC